MDFVYDIDLVAGLAGRIVGSLAKLPDFIDTTVTGGINLYDVQRPALGYRLTNRAGIARLPATAAGKAAYGLSQNAAGAGLAGAARAAEEIGMSDTATTEGVE